jgi:hypothetical protein
LAIPVFVSGVDGRGKEFREFTAALNISGGGALLITRRYLRVSTEVSLEIPSPPLPSSHLVASTARNLAAKLIKIAHNEQCYLCGVEFIQPLIDPSFGMDKGKKHS